MNISIFSLNILQYRAILALYEKSQDYQMNNNNGKYSHSESSISTNISIWKTARNFPPLCHGKSALGMVLGCSKYIHRERPGCLKMIASAVHALSHRPTRYMNYTGYSYGMCFAKVGHRFLFCWETNGDLEVRLIFRDFSHDLSQFICRMDASSKDF